MQIDADEGNTSAMVHMHYVTAEIPASHRNDAKIMEYTRRGDTHHVVNIVPSLPPSQFVLPVEDCVPLPKSPIPDVKICLYKEGSDVWISASLKVRRNDTI